jgi:hypothetical protein
MPSYKIFKNLIYFVYLSNKTITTTRTKLMTSEIDMTAMYASGELHLLLLTSDASERNTIINFHFYGLRTNAINISLSLDKNSILYTMMQ